MTIVQPTKSNDMECFLWSKGIWKDLKKNRLDLWPYNLQGPTNAPTPGFDRKHHAIFDIVLQLPNSCKYYDKPEKSLNLLPNLTVEREWN